MATNTPDSVDRVEAAADITLMVSQGDQQGGAAGASAMEIPISRLDTTKDISIEQVRESSIKASGYAITSIEYSGTMMFQGSKKTKTSADGTQVHLDDVLYDDHGVPEPVTVSITHEMNDETETYQTVLVTSESYQVRNEETTEQAYDWVAMNRSGDRAS